MDDILQIKFTDITYPEDSLEVFGFPEHVTIKGFEFYEMNETKRTTIRITPKQARQLATFLSDYCDKQGV